VIEGTIRYLGCPIQIDDVGKVLYLTLGAFFHEKAHSVKTDVVVATVCLGSYAVLSQALLSNYPALVIASLTMLFAGLRVAPLALLRFLIVDPACGSVAFLIEAHQYLLDWYRDRYVEDSLKKWSDRLYKGRGGQCLPWLRMSHLSGRIPLLSRPEAMEGER
jgi:hypothetical protein